MTRPQLAWLVGGLILCQPIISSAQSADVASALFQQAKTKLEKGDFAGACPLLDESYRLAQKPGTLFTLANCRDREGKLAAAQARYAEYLRAHEAMKDRTERSRHAERVEIAKQRLDELAALVPTLKLVWQGEIPSNVKIRVDTVELTANILNTALPFDPGPHEIVVQRPGKTDDSQHVTLEQGAKLVVRLSLDSSGSAQGKAFREGEEPQAKIEPKKSFFSGPWHPMKTAGVTAVGVGAVGLLLGGAMGGLALSEKGAAAEKCLGPQGYDCNEAGYSSVQSMRTYASVSTASFIAGGILAGAGVVLVVLAPAATREKTAAVKIRARGGPGQGFVGVEGAF